MTKFDGSLGSVAGWQWQWQWRLAAMAFVLAGGGCSSSGGSPAGSGGGQSGSGGGAVGTAGAGGGAGGAAATGGAAGIGSGGASGTGGSALPAGCTLDITGTATRPQLTDATAACFTAERYLAQGGTVSAPATDNWNPMGGLPAATTLTATLTVAADGSGTHTTVQAAITQAKTAGGTARVYILVKPGTYPELVCVDGSVPITLFGADADASQVVIAFGNYNGKAVDTTKTNGCAVPSGATYGTSGSSTFFVKANGFQALNLTIANDFVEGALSSSIQAVALTVQGDQAVFQNVRLLGNQDTLQVKAATDANIARSYFKDSYIEGDTDFIFGRGTSVFDGCTIMYVAERKTNSTHLAPSTTSNYPFGFLIVNSKILGAASISGTTALGRAWDDSSSPSANGQAVIRETEIGTHVNRSVPWTAAASSGRAFDATRNRLYEYKNTGAGAAP